MATTKRHIAVYLAPAVEQALKEFCEQRGLKSKKGVVLSAGVNAVLAEFFGISDIEEGSTPVEASSIPNEVSSTSIKSGNTPSKISSIPTNSRSNTPTDAVSSIPSETLAVEVLPGKLQA
jgi:hypothetical protein